MWVCTDVKPSFAWRLQPYTGKTSGGPAKVTQGKRVVLQMTDRPQGNMVTVDDFFALFPLAEEVLARKMTMVGTVRRKKPHWLL